MKITSTDIDGIPSKSFDINQYTSVHEVSPKHYAAACLAGGKSQIAIPAAVWLLRVGKPKFVKLLAETAVVAVKGCSGQLPGATPFSKLALYGVAYR